MKNLIKKIANFPAIKTDKKLIVLLSDDWGSTRIKSAEDQRQLEQKGFKIASRFDKFDTIESDIDLQNLFEVLLKHKDHKGNHPVITAVTNVGNPNFSKIKESNFKDYFFESNEDTYSRYADSNQVLKLVEQGISQNIFIPELHGREHVQVNWWMNELQNQDSFARKVFENEFFFLGPQYLKNPKRGRGIGAAFDTWTSDDVVSHKKIATSAAAIFQKQYGYTSTHFTPPAMFYNPDLESTLVENGTEWLDVGRFFKVPMPDGKEKHQYNYLGRKKKSGLKVLVRNCVFETNMTASNNGVASCLQGIQEAFDAKQPALISNHRASFVGGIKKENRDSGLNALNDLLTSILQKWPDAEFVAVKNVSSVL